MTTTLHTTQAAQVLKKCPTGIQGLDDVTFGGLPLGRTALVCGAAGCGKTLLAMQFLVNGALLYDEPGIFMSFEENESELTENFASLGVDLNKLVAQNKISLDYVHLDKNEIAEAGDYDLDGLFIRLDYAIQAIGAKRVVLDTIEALFSGLANTTILRAELRRLFRWLKERGVTAIVTGERGNGTLTRHGIEEYVSDCVILLEHKVIDQISTRRLRIAKYRGSAHGTNEYPFLIDEQGICLMPITSVGLNAIASTERISSGIKRLDTMLGGHGFYVGSSILISGTAGTGKTSLAASAAHAACRQGRRCLYFAFEESRSQIVRNMNSIGIDLEQWTDQGLLEIQASRPTLFGLEMHLVNMYKKVNESKPQLVILDPISNLTAAGNFSDVLTDTWIALQNIETNGERNRVLYLLKSRGMAHSNQIREFVLTDQGIELRDVYTGPEGVLTGSARYAQEEKELTQRLLREQEIERKRREIERKHQKMLTAIADLQADFESEKEELEKNIALEGAHLQSQDNNKLHLAKLRNADD
ncbi:MAG: kaiC [Anaerospora sp.]|nr:kaiC [Anaerospora sp.]